MTAGGDGRSGDRGRCQLGCDQCQREHADAHGEARDHPPRCGDMIEVVVAEGGDVTTARPTSKTCRVAHEERAARAAPKGAT